MTDIIQGVDINIGYDELVDRYSIITGSEPALYITRESDTPKQARKLLVSMATLMNAGKYAGLESYYRHFDGDVLCVVDPNNTYYLRQDGGVGFKSDISGIINQYSPENVIFCGASMAGFSAIDSALFFNANAVVNNPQVSLSATIETGWEKLVKIVEQIPVRLDLQDKTYNSRNTVIGAMIGQHPMDKKNRDILFEMVKKITGVGFIYGGNFDPNHKYYYQGIRGFLTMVEIVLKHRKLNDEIQKIYPFSIHQ